MPRQSKKDIAADFLKMAASGRAREAFERYAASGFRHHNAWFPGDGPSLMKAMDENAAQNPDKELRIHRVVEDGDQVATYSHVRHNKGEQGAAVVHFFRFEGDRIAELWDVGQEVPADSPNKNGMF
ncbi:MAG TPA: nuclear transport factor 2 family protein [Gemmatimonadaceae bacterium]|nr:nuclear transport factor 2 family protein [Gemmatimonadaceae bacterium]